jgi:hypothetical protein
VPPMPCARDSMDASRSAWLLLCLGVDSCRMASRPVLR